jgi:HEAT repeat-containing protein 5
MDGGDGCMLAAMDGIEFVANGASGSTLRKEPTALFFVIFGLAYEALASPDTDSGSGHRKVSVIALKCLKHLVRPQYSGQALLDQANFEELASLFYRMAITEPPVVVVYILEVLSSLVVTQDIKLAELDALAVTG